jgi:predicted RNA binding protein YcfA (HicA-like mRNA interferase family)
MSQHQKLVDRLLTVPADFTWDEMVRLLSGFGYKENSSGGSHRRFENPTSGDIIMGLVKPHHPHKEVRRAYLRKVIQHLGLTSDI